jgi:hypothetical protein
MTPTYCPVGWRLYDAWDIACRDNVTHEPTTEDIERENRLWLAWQDHKNACPECKKVRNG